MTELEVGPRPQRIEAGLDAHPGGVAEALGGDSRQDRQGLIGFLFPSDE
jgi:hypothetical protein